MLERWSDRVVAVFAFVTPLFVLVGAKDTFRVPKDALFRAEAIVLVALYVAAAIVEWPRDWHIEWRRPEIALLLVIVAWTAIATLASTNRARSLDALVTVCAAVVVFFATVAFARRASMRALFLIVIPAVANTLLGALQEFDIWQPFAAPPDVTHHQRSTALIGNPNDAGGYVAAVALAAIAAAIVARRQRPLFTAAAVVLAIGLVINQTLTAIVAFIAGAIVLTAMRSFRNAAIGVVAALLVGVIAVATFAPARQRAINMREWIEARNYNALLTNRLTPFVTAAMMARDHPLTGVGPGAFAWQYFPYKIEAEKRWPSLRTAYLRGGNFGEVHNDHLQVLAESGVPGYLILLAVLVALARFSRGDADDDDRAAFAKLLALPIAVEFFVLALAQFPLELTAVLSQFVFLAALCVAWREA